MDDAIRAEGERRGFTRAELIGSLGERGTVPFSSDRKYAAVFAGDRVFVKGAPIVLLDRSAIDAGDRERIRQANAEMAGRGLRVLAFASAPAGGGVGDAAIDSLRFEGLGGFIDPPAEGVKDAIATLRGAGLRTVMITGDQKLTAEAIARDLGVDGVYSRVTPEDKLRIVEDLQQRGEIVAMLGDGVNDAAALKRANVGIAMGRRGTDVAKEAAAIVLQDDRFGTIAAAVEEGRVIYANIRKFVFYLFSCNLAEVLVLLAAAAAGMPLPLLPLQLLWLNMLTDTFPALALAVEPADRDVMRQPPRDPREALLSRAFIARIVLYAALIAAATLAVFGWALTHAPERATTMAFMTLAFAQVLHLGNARSAGAVLTPSAISANPWAIAGAATAVLLQTAAIAVPWLRQVLHLQSLTAVDWFVVVSCAAAPALFGQAWKLARPVERAAAPR
jgi:Ca2+-transporting ATPase